MPSPTATLTITTIPTQTAGVPFKVTATYVLTPGVWQEQLQYKDTATGALIPVPAAAVVLNTSSITFNHPGNLAPGNHTITVTDRLTGASAKSNSFLVVGGKVITPTTPTGVVINQSFSFTGSLSGYTSAPSLNWQLDGGALTSFAATNSTSFATPVTVTTAGAHVLHVSDGSVSGQTASFTPTAPATTISPVTPTGVLAGQTFTFAGTLSGYLTVPTLTYFFDNATTGIPVTGVTLTGWSMVLTAPAAGNHTITISDGSKIVAVPLTVGGTPKTITPFAPTTPTAGQTFTFTGSLAGYQTIPALTYSIDGALPVPMTGVSVTSWSMTIVAPATGTHTIVVSDGTVSGSTQFTVSAVVTGSRKFYEYPGMDGSFVVQPFQSSSKWITSGPLITALRSGTPTTNVKGNFGVPFYIGQASDPLVTVTDGTHSIVVHVPLGAIVETPASQFDQSIGGVDATQPYLVWSISGASINTGSVAASGSVITGTYGFAVNDGAGLMMVDIVTGEPGDNNSWGGIQDFHLAKIQADPNYVLQQMLAFQTDISFQASSAGPIWPLKLIDTSTGGSSTPYAGPIPQGVTVGIPANVARPTGQTRGFYALWDQLQQFGMFNYNFGQVGGVNFVIYSASGSFASLVSDIQAAWVTIGQNYLCILDYTNGVSGAQYSLATTKGAVPGSTNAFPAPPPLDLSPTGGKNVAPASFGAWYPSGYNATPTNGGATATFVITPTIPTGVVAGTAFSFTGVLTGYTTAPSLTYAINGAAAIALPGVTASGWSTSLTIPSVGTVSIVVLDAAHAVSGSTSFQVTDGTVTVVPTTWNPSDLAGGIILSNNNYTATSSGSATPYAAPQGVRATNPISASQIVLWEITIDSVTQNWAAGVADANAALAITGGLGADGDSLGYYPATGAGSQPPSTVYYGGNQLSAGNGVAATAGTVLTFVANGQNLYVSSAPIRSTSGVSWNSNTAADPIANVGGFAFASMPTPYYPVFDTGESGSGASINDGTKPLSAFATTFLSANPQVATLSGQAAPPPPVKSITPIQPSNAVVNASFTFAGNLSGYSAAPSLTYLVDGGTPAALPGVTATGWNTTLTIATVGSHTITVSDGTISGATTFTVSQQSQSGNRVGAPLTGSVTTGTWVTGQKFNLAGSPSGLNYMQYNYLLPAQYNSNLIYPILFVGHPINSGGNPYPLNGQQFVINASYGSNYSLDTMYNSVAFRTAHPCIVVACQCDQTGNSGGTNANGVPGYNDTAPNGSWNERAEVGIVQAFLAGSIVANLQVDPTLVLHIGYSLGGIDTLAQIVDNNAYNGPGFKIWTAGATFSDQLFRQNVSNSSYFSRMTTVPLATFSFDGDNVPSSYDQPAWTSYTGNSNYPTKSTYDSGGMAACRAGTSQYYYINNGGSNSATTFMPMNALGGDGDKMYAWLFTQFGPGSITPSATITGVSLSTNSGQANSAVGTSIGTLTAGASGGALNNVVFTLASQSTAGAFRISGTSLQFASAAVAAGSYTVTISVAASNATNSPQSYTLPITIAGTTGTAFLVSGGKVLTPAGTVYRGAGINITESSMSQAVTNAQAQPMTTLFPGINLVRLACHSYVTLSQIQSFVNTLTALKIVVIIENHQNFNSSGQVNGTAGGGQGVILTGSALTTESNWYTGLATAFAGNPYVWWGTNNEPSIVDPNTGQNNVPGLSTWHLATYKAIRNTGNNNPILIDLNWITTLGTSGGMTASVYAQMTNVLWDFHMYDVIANYSADTPTLRSALASVIASLGTITSKDGVIPIISAEYGNSTNGSAVDPGGLQNCQVIQAATDNQTVVGCAAWIWDNFGTGAADQLRNGSQNTLSTYGQQVAGWIASVPSSNPGTESPAGTKVTGTNGSINASPNPGVAGSGNLLTITAAGTIALNGVVLGGANVITLYYDNNHTAWQQNAPGDWYTPITASTTGSLSATPPPGYGPGGSVTIPVTQFANLFGANTHIDFSDTVYSNNPTAIGTAMAYLGWNQLRQAIYTGYNTTAYNGLAAQGLSLDVDLQNGLSDVTAFMSAITQYIAANPGHILAIEGANEVVNWPVTFNGLTGIPAANALQQNLFSTVRGTASTASLPVYMYTFGNGTPSQLGTGNQSAYATYGNAHIYPHQSIGGGVTPYTSFQANVPFQVSTITPSLNTVITECGYYTMPDGNYGVTEDVQMRYTLDMMCDVAALNYPKAYFYELFDNKADPGNTNSELHFGLFHSNFSPKPAATAIHNMMAILADVPGSGASTVSYTISGLPNSAMNMALTKSNGAVDIVVWAEPVIWNQTTQSQVAPPTVSVTLTFSRPYSSVKVFDPIVGTTAQTSQTNVSSVTVSVTDHPLIVEII